LDEESSSTESDSVRLGPRLYLKYRPEIERERSREERTASPTPENPGNRGFVENSAKAEFCSLSLDRSCRKQIAHANVSLAKPHKEGALCIYGFPDRRNAREKFWRQ